MKREASVYLFVGLLIVGIFLVAYYVNLGITGFAVHQEDFSAGQHNGTLYNGSSVVLNSSANATSGDYTSKVFDAGASSQWNNLTFAGSQNLTFQVRACDDANCSNSSFASADLNNINLTGQYFQYRAFLTSPENSLQSVSIGSSPIASTVTSVSIVEPAGTKSSSTGIALNFVTVGDALTCWYDVHDASDNAEIKSNETISGCSNITFDLGAGEGSYVINVYANGTSGFGSDSSSFSLDIASSSSTEEEEEEDSGAASTTQVPVTARPPIIKELSASNIESSTVAPGSTHEVRWSVTNSGNQPLSSCTMAIQGASASWASASSDSVSLNAGDSHEFLITIAVPEETADGQNAFTVSATCAEASTSKDFTLNVEEEKLGFEIIDAQRTRSDRVRVVYSLEEMTGNDQDVEVHFTILDSANNEVANSSQNRSIDAGETDEFSLNIPVDESLEGDFSLSATVNSQVYTTTVLEPITLGAPVGGFAIFDGGLGTGGFVVLLIVVLAIVALIVVSRRMRKSGKTLKSLIDSLMRH